MQGLRTTTLTQLSPEILPLEFELLGERTKVMTDMPPKKPTTQVVHVPLLYFHDGPHYRAAASLWPSALRGTNAYHLGTCFPFCLEPSSLSIYMTPSFQSTMPH